jgi:hypothetical protein
MKKTHSQWVHDLIALSRPAPIAGKTCGKHLYVIAKVEAGLPLSIAERDFVAGVLRRELLTKNELKAYRRWRELQRYEAAQRIAEQAAPYGQREDFKLSLYGKSKDTLKHYLTRLRRHPH